MKHSAASRVIADHTGHRSLENRSKVFATWFFFELKQNHSQFEKKIRLLDETASVEEEEKNNERLIFFDLRLFLCWEIQQQQKSFRYGHVTT